MISLGDEYLCYSESNTGQYAPMICSQKLDGTLSFRDMTKDDLPRIIDNETLPGGWLFRKTMNAAGTWIKRFTVIRGPLLFLFHNPQNNKPTAVIPLDNCKIFVPDNLEKTFDVQRNFRANDGYEFDIRHTSRPTIRLYALSELERSEWVGIMMRRASFPFNQGVITTLTKLLPARNNITMTDVKLTGSNLSNVLPTSQGDYRPDGQDNTVNNLMSHASYPASPSPTPAFLTNTVYQQPPQPSEQSSYAMHQMRQPPMPPHSSTGATIGRAPSPNSSMSSLRHSHTTTPQKDSNIAFLPPPPGALTDLDATVQSIIGDWNDTIQYTKQMQLQQRLGNASYSGGSGGGGGPGSITGSSTIRSTPSKFNKNELDDKFNHIQHHLQQGLQKQQQAREREQTYKAKMETTRDDLIEGARKKEADHPLTLSELFRVMLYFYDEELTEDPDPGSKNKFPMLHGHAIEEMLLSVYRRYSGDGGFMNIESFIEFIDDCNLMQTHAELDDNDAPVEEYRTALDPVKLVSSLPKYTLPASLAVSYGLTEVTNIASVSHDLGGGESIRAGQGRGIFDERHLEAMRKDSFVINFGQFYQLLLRITQIVYKELAEEDFAVAFHKILYEVICPFHLWCIQDHQKKGALDPLVLEERILLVVTTYAPNLWRVFVTYATDAVGGMLEIHSEFPEVAQVNEKGMFKSSSNALPSKFLPSGKYGKTSPADSFCMSELACLKFARDYGITPYVVSNSVLKELVRELMIRKKTIISSKLPQREQIQARMQQSMAQIEKQVKSKELKNFPMHLGNKPGSHWMKAKTNANARKGGKDGSLPGSPERGGGAGGDTNSVIASVESLAGSKKYAPPNHNAGGVGFSEFVELLCRIAMDGLEQDNYAVIFPTPFSKVLAILTIWGVADLKILEEVRSIRTDEAA